MSGDELKFIKEAFDSNWIAPLGPHVDAFEKETAEYAGVKAALALSCGSAAIHLGLRLLDVKAGDVVFCSTLTFIASVAPAVYQKRRLSSSIPTKIHGICLPSLCKRPLTTP